MKRKQNCWRAEKHDLFAYVIGNGRISEASILMSASIKSSHAEVQRDCTPTGTAVIQKADDKQLARRWWNGNLTLLLRMESDATTWHVS